VLNELGLSAEDAKEKKFFRGRGCEVCNNMGFKGRIGIFELMLITDEMRGLIMNNASTDVIRVEARKTGMRLLRDVGLDFVFDGTTTPEEVIRETMMEA